MRISEICDQPGAIDISGISTKSDYYDTDEIYNVLTEYILKEFENNTSFDKLVFKYMIISGELTGSQVINLLYDQGILNTATDTDYSDYKAGVMGSYDFICKKLKILRLLRQCWHLILAPVQLSLRIRIMGQLKQ